MGLRAYNLSGVTQYVITDGVRPIFPNGLSGPIGAYSFASIAPSTGGASVFAVLPPAATATYPNNKSIPLPDLFSGAVPVGVPVDITEMMASAREAAFVLLETARLVDPQRVYFVWTGPPEFRTGTLQVATPANVGGFAAKRVFTVATRPSATLNTGGEIVVSDSVPPGKWQRSDGAAWTDIPAPAPQGIQSVSFADMLVFDPTGWGGARVAFTSTPISKWAILPGIDGQRYTLYFDQVGGSGVLGGFGTGSYAGISDSVNGTGRAAHFAGPSGVAYDGAGNLYIAEASTIRKLVIATGVVTTIAGLAGAFGPDDGTGSAARFNNPSGLVYDGAGNLYVADTNSNAVRKVVVATGVVTTLAAFPAALSQPVGIAYDGAGNLYVGDYGDSSIKRITVPGGIVTTIAGMPFSTGSTNGTGSTARFNQPKGVTLDGAGNLYVADSANRTIRKVEVSTGVVTLLAGTALSAGQVDGTGTAARFDGPSDVEWDGGTKLYVVDQNNHTIREIVISSAVVTTPMGRADVTGCADGADGFGRFFFPAAATVDLAGNLYVVESSNNAVRKVVIAGAVISTIAGAPNGTRQAGIFTPSTGAGKISSISWQFDAAMGVWIETSRALNI